MSKQNMENVDKTVKMATLEGLPENVTHMWKMVRKCQTCSNNAIVGSQNDIFDTFLHFPGGPKSTPPGPHLTFCFDCIRHFPGTLPNLHFDILFDIFREIRENPCYTRVVRLRG